MNAVLTKNSPFVQDSQCIYILRATLTSVRWILTLVLPSLTGVGQSVKSIINITSSTVFSVKFLGSIVVSAIWR